MRNFGVSVRKHVICGVAGISLSIGGAAHAQTTFQFHIPAQPLGTALQAFGIQSGVTVVADAGLTHGKQSRGFTALADPETALKSLLRGTGLILRRRGDIFLVGNDKVSAVEQTQPQEIVPGDIVVTAQKRSERIQDVPIAISAFSGKTLDEMKIETGGDLLKSIPNVTFSKNNFTGYNFSIRGIGTKAVAVSTDPAVAVAFNSSNLITNRLFEQEFYDIERVEVLRRPQGTLYGRNATAGVVNIISKTANLTRQEGFIKLEEGNYETRRVSGAFNLPIIADKLAVRAAGAFTDRDGFAVNDRYGIRIDGRHLWSTRSTVSAKSVDAIHLDLIWEHFDEDDDRQRAGKQLCHKDDGPTMVGDIVLQQFQRDALSQGCKDGSLYDDGAFSTPNGRSLNAYQAYNLLTFGRGLIADPLDPSTAVDPYGNVRQAGVGVDMLKERDGLRRINERVAIMRAGRISVDIGRRRGEL